MKFLQKAWFLKYGEIMYVFLLIYFETHIVIFKFDILDRQILHNFPLFISLEILGDIFD